ncbi:aminopeptidase P N-terminal domain-containing protein [Flaviaesturariibacter aridisoli]|uniref:Xaa-Pro aminopeptidase n=1 Tax=Flaviaesturariibacter aridisoli TaxID=2545761 RepID=A0A4R4E0B1_9BACT|nr:aminopeptidase P N-terminal domain-containing protein [Flaviaesturariibacter aridisoli]TCZ68626.1 M24 family metallopeptidase [Flaviaesturariibacter aridisoli]
MKHLPLNPELFSSNRRRFVERLAPRSIAIFLSADEYPANGDALHPFRQNSDLYWLCGIQQEDSMVILFPDNPDPKYREVLVLVRPNELKEKWDGKRLRREEATAISGISSIVWLDSLEGLLQGWIHAADNIYLDSNENDRRGPFFETRDYRYIAELQRRYPLHRFERAARILGELRAVKTPFEIEVTRQAIAITANTFERVCRFVKPGVMEYEIEAEIVHSFLSQRASGEAYSSIIASGDRARTLHYVSNNAECKDGELLLLDFGAAYGGYNADLSRTIPVNGKFTARQAEVYNACLHLHNYAKSLLKPGISILDYTDKVGEEATKQFVQIGLLSESDVKNEDADNRAYRKYLYHGISHHLGLDVHDLGTRSGPLLEGMLLTVEPGIYIEEEGMGIRIENNIWITKDGNVDLFDGIPITVEEIEAAMRG